MSRLSNVPIVLNYDEEIKIMILQKVALRRKLYLWNYKL